MQEIIAEIFQTVTNASPQQLNAVIALAAISLAGFAIYAVMSVAKNGDKK